MKKTSKILIIFITIFSILSILGTNSVFAVADHHIAWRKDVNGDGKPDLIFRKYSTATPEQIEAYIKEKASGYVTTDDGSSIYGFTYNSIYYPSKWVEPDANGVKKPSTKEFQTIGYTFHSEMLGEYVYTHEGTTAATMVSTREDNVIVPITNSISNMFDYFNNVKARAVKPKLLEDEEVIETLPSLIYEVYSNKGAVNRVEFGTKWNVSTVQPRNRLVYRYAIVEAQRIEDGVLDTEYVYIEDRVIYHDDLLKLRAALDESEWNEETDMLFISDIVISEAQYDDGGYELSKTAAEFFSQYKKRGYTREFWPIEVVGTAEDATRAALNSFDNVITIPKKSKRNVYIRHVGIGYHTSLTRDALSEAVLLESNNPYLDVKDDFNGEYETIYPNRIMDGKVEAYEGEIEIYQYIKKVANEYSGADKYVPIGYNIAAGNSFEEAFTVLQLKELFGIVSDQGTSEVELDGLIAESPSECVIIEFYYTKKPDILYVNHLLVDVNNNVLKAEKQNIKANNQAFTGTLFTEPISAVKPPYDSLEDNESLINYIQERYYRQSGQSVLVRTSLFLLDERFSLKHIFDGVRYVGYQKYSDYVTLDKLYGTKVTPKKEWYKPFDVVLGVVAEPGTKQVNFYYYNQDKKEAAIPDKFISMNYYFKSDSSDEGNCYNENQKEIISVPSGVKAKAGITELSKVMASAINLEYVDSKNNKQEVDVKLTYTCGKDKTTINVNNVKYSFSYFRVDELVVDTLQKITVFDASEDWSSTNGEPIFNWSNDKKEYSYNTSTPNLEVKAIKTIDTSDYDNTKNWKNYATVEVTDNKGNRSNSDPSKIEMSHRFLSESQIKEVDANGDGKINSKDISESAKKVTELTNTLKNVNKVNEYTIDKYEKKQQQLKEAEENYRKAINRSEVLGALVTAARGDLEEAEKALAATRDGIVAEENNIAEEKEIKKSNAKKIADATVLINTAQTQTIPTLRARQETQEEELEALKSDLSSYVSASDSWSDTVAEYEAEKTAAESVKAVYESKRTSLNIQLTSASSTRDEAATEVSTHCVDGGNETLCDGARKKLSAADDALVAAKNNFDENERLIAEQDSIIGGIEDNIANAEGWVNYYDRMASSTRTSITNKEEDIKDTKAAIVTQENKIKQWKQDILNYQADTERANRSISSSQSAIRRLSSTIQPLTDKVAQAEANLDIKLKDWNVSEEANVIAAKLWLEACKLEEKHRESSAEKALAAVREAEQKLQAQEAYDDNLRRKYAAYKAEYDIYAEIKSEAGIIVTKANKKAIADIMGINITFKVSNMHIKINGENLNDPSKLIATKTLPLKDAIDERTEIDAPEPLFYQKAYNGIGTKVTDADYTYSQIAKETANGVRTIAAEAKYKTEILIAKEAFLYKSKVDTVEDDVYYSKNIDIKQELTNGRFKLDYDGLITKKSRQVNIYTPIAASATLKSDEYDLVDQSNITDSSVQIIQLGVPFTVTFGNKVDTTIKPYTSLRDAKKYNAGYYIKFDFDICDVTILRKNVLGKWVKAGWVPSTGTVSTNLNTIKNQVIKAGTWIGPIETGSKDYQLKAQVYSNVTDDTINAAEETRSYTVRAYAYNATSKATGYSLGTYYADKYDLLIDMLQYRSTIKNIVKNICTDKITTGAETDVPSYFADRTYELVVLNKLYDFRITDVKDVAWKSVFRKNTNSIVNAHTGNLYYSGIRKWIYSNKDVTKTTTRTAAEIGKDPVRTLPIGPYKHTDKTYVNAPKLGYTFSYDMKVTGAFYDEDGKPLTNKYVDIKTKFYYISKDGKTFLEEGRNGIYLFYKNANGKYVRLDETNGGGYELKFTPNDAYRYITDKEKITLSKDVEVLGNLRSIKLTHKMATVYQTYDTANTANNGTIITYYGEYKLPNSTIAVAVDSSGNYDINKPLKDGYIGVIFDITAKAGTYGKNSTPISLSYGAPTKTVAEINANRKTADLLKTADAANTSQWDYEGYLGFKDFGYTAKFTAATAIRLEKGQWILSNDMYKKIKGTVMLYDIDDRAATDFE
ncbi:MAG: hypothetical protein IKL68_00480 [Clostridia bacterium]|nr:hypothetical protein [Clostridia bacterium]